MKFYLPILIISAFVFSCQPQEQFEKSGDGIVVNIQEGKAQQVKLQVLSDKIIRVVAAPEKIFDTKSLVVSELETPFTNWTVEKEGNDIIVKTKALKATIDPVSGEITFYDNNGNLLLKELENGKSFSPIETDSNNFSIRQVFESPEDEAFYGLGQHQNRQMNLKGEDVELAQHNIVAVVPFVYSNKNYGILWDNYSITRFGDPREYKTKTSLNLFSADGAPGGLTARYYSGDKLISEEVVKEINHQYLECGSMPENYSMPNGKVVYEGAFSSDVEGKHKFKLYASGYFKLWIDDILVMDKWRQGWNPWYNLFKVEVKKGEKHKIKIEWDLAGAPYIALKHLDPLPDEEQNNLSLFSEVADQIDYYFIAGDNADEVISGYRNITGKAPIMPKWAFGLWQSRERYRTQEELLDVVKEYRKRQIPLDNIVLDWQYWEDPKWGSHEFDLSRFPDPKGMIEELHNQLNTRIMISVWPKFNVGTENFKVMHEKGYLYQRNLDKERKDWVGPGYVSTFYDPFNPGARQMFWDQMNEKLFTLGIDAWWLDATEPDIHSNLSIDERKLNMNNYLGSGSKYFNAYSLMNSKGIYEKQRETDPDKRVFILTRSAFAGQQKYAAATWSGDVVTRWSDLADQIPAGLNIAIAGIPYWTHDIGGFAVEPRYERPNNSDLEEWRELNMRWFQFGVFSPLFRIHGQFPFREIFNIAPEGHEVYNAMVDLTKLRYRLMPYIYTMAGKTYFDDYTIMRPLVMDFGGDQQVLDLKDQYMFGPSIMVAPVVDYKQRQKEVYLPNNTGWYDFYSGNYYPGGTTISVDAPLVKIPLFIKEGSIIPLGPELQYVAEKPADPLKLYVFTGADGIFNLYEDEGVNYNYEKGKYSIIPISYNEQNKRLTIGERKGEFDGMLKDRKIQVVWIKKDSNIGIDLDIKPNLIIDYDGSEQIVTVN